MPRIPGQEDYDNSSGGNFGTLESDEYRCRIVSWEEHENNSQFAKPGGTGKSIWFKLEPVAYEHDPEAELVDKDSGEPIHPDKTLIFFYDPDRVGLVPVIAKSRKFLAAALNVPVEEPIEFDTYDDLVGKEVVASVIVKDGNNRIDAVRPVKARKSRAAARTADVTKTAKEVFGDDVVSATATVDEDEDY